MPHRLLLHAFKLLLATACLFTAPFSRAQLIDSFDDGDFHAEPSWSGDVDRWQIGELHGYALQSNGAAAADTIYLSAASAAAFGTWRFTLAHHGVNLSSFNGARIFLTSDRTDPRRSAVGYFLQLGTNNTDVLSLWRADGSLATQRVELARTAETLAVGDSNRFHIVVERDLFGRFRVYANNALVLSATDLRHSSSSHFSIWIKHTAQGAESFLLDDVAISAEDARNDGGPSYGEIIINEVMYDPAVGRSEFIELQNRGRTPFDLRLLRIRDERSDPIPITYTKYLLETGAYAVLAEDSASLQARAPGVRIIPIPGWPPLNNGGDTIVLTGPAGAVDSLRYEGTGSIRGVSLERIDPDGPTESYNFGRSTDASGSTPGRVNSIFAIDDTAPQIRFVEETGPNTLELHFSEPVRTRNLTTSSALYSSPILGLLPLSDSSVRIVLDRGPEDPSISIENVRDRKGNLAGRLTHPIAFLPRPGDLAITEIMYEPLADKYDGRADQVEFFELVNVGRRLISASQFIRTRLVDETGDADSLRFGRSFSGLLPGAYMIASVHDSAAVRAAYPSTPLGGGIVHVLTPGLTLANGGDLIRIHNRLGETLDEVAYEPGWHHPNLVETRGHSLERINIDAPAADAGNWSSSTAADGATPGMANSLALEPSPVGTSYGIDVEPSPFSPDGDGHHEAAIISYRLRSANSTIRVRIYDLDGFEVRTLMPAALASAKGAVVWNGRDGGDRSLRMGIYIVVLEAVDAENRRVEQYKKPVVLANSPR